MKWFLLGVFLVMASPAVAQEQVAFLSKALAALQAQRNEAMDRTVNAEARAALLAEENAALRKRIEELTPKAPTPEK